MIYRLPLQSGLKGQLLTTTGVARSPTRFEANKMPPFNQPYKLRLSRKASCAAEVSKVKRGELLGGIKSQMVSLPTRRARAEWASSELRRCVISSCASRGIPPGGRACAPGDQARIPRAAPGAEPRGPRPTGQSTSLLNFAPNAVIFWNPAQGVWPPE